MGSVRNLPSTRLVGGMENVLLISHEEIAVIWRQGEDVDEQRSQAAASGRTG